jgi:hypothetical protein
MQARGMCLSPKCTEVKATQLSADRGLAYDPAPTFLSGSVSCAFAFILATSAPSLDI